jgi:hypothetical protein
VKKGSTFHLKLLFILRAFHWEQYPVAFSVNVIFAPMQYGSVWQFRVLSETQLSVLDHAANISISPAKEVLFN